MERAEFDLRDKVIVVTGGAGLIGREICDAFLAYGARVVLTDIIKQEHLAALASRFSSANRGRCLPVQADITSQDSVDALFRETAACCGRLDVLVNLAAIDAKFDDKMKMLETSRFECFPIDLLEKSMDVNCIGMVRVTQAALRLMLPRKCGNIINVASTYSLVAPNQDLYKFPGQEKQVFKSVDYVATKSMVPNFSRYIATLYARNGIRCNTIVPHAIFNGHSKEFQDNFARLSPLGRMCRTEELRGPFVFLASDASSYMTGSLLEVTGGWTAW